MKCAGNTLLDSQMSHLGSLRYSSGMFPTVSDITTHVGFQVIYVGKEESIVYFFNIKGLCFETLSILQIAKILVATIFLCGNSFFFFKYN